MLVASRRRPLLPVALAMAIAVGACGSSPSPSPSPAGIDTAPPSASASATPAPTDTPIPSPTPGLAERPFTVLLLGGDNDFRTDAIMVVGVDPVAHTMAMASIPRDTIDVPLPGGGTFANQKINAFYDYAQSHPAAYPQGAGRATADMVGTLLGIHIDFFAATSFQGFVNIVNAFGGVTVTLAQPLVDPSYQVTTYSFGIRFPAGKQTLNGTRSLIFVRTRHSDNDFARARRQQQFLVAAGRQLLANPAKLVALVGAAGNVITNFPLSELPSLIDALAALDPASIRQAVLGPSAYESAGSCTCGYALVPKIGEMRKLAALYFPWAVAP